jgi:hypothetical protein
LGPFIALIFVVAIPARTYFWVAGERKERAAREAVQTSAYRAAEEGAGIELPLSVHLEPETVGTSCSFCIFTALQMACSWTTATELRTNAAQHHTDAGFP